MSRMDTTDAELEAAIAARLVVMRIVTGAMIAGAVAFAAVSIVLGQAKDVQIGAEDDDQADAAKLPIVSVIGVAGAIAQSVLAVMLPGVAARQLVKKAETSAQLLEAFFASLMLTFALLEGAIFFNCLACLIEQQWWTLAVIGGLLLWMVTQFPTHTRIAHWIETQRLTAG